jgi:hypothetical protein
MEEHAARSNKAPGTPDTTALPRSGMSRRSHDPTSCAATASAHVGQGHRTRIAVSQTRTPRPPPLTRRPLPCGALVEAATHACTSATYRDRYQQTKTRIGKQRGGKVAQIDSPAASPRRSGTCSAAINPSLPKAPPTPWPPDGP